MAHSSSVKEAFAAANLPKTNTIDEINAVLDARVAAMHAALAASAARVNTAVVHAKLDAEPSSLTETEQNYVMWLGLVSHTEASLKSLEALHAL